MLNISNLKAKAQDKQILNGVDLEVRTGETHVIMGPNGSGKSTLAQVLMGSPVYQVLEGSVEFDGKNLLELSVDKRAKAGLFLSFQYPSEITGVSVASYLRLIYNKKHETNLSPVNFRKLLKEKTDILGISEDFINRALNEGFSGGEKKRMEMLQMLVLEPKLVILDEVDSGLDVDALKIVAEAVNYLKSQTGATVIVITHYARILNYIKPDFVHIMREGKIVKSGMAELAQEIESLGYSPAVSEA